MIDYFEAHTKKEVEKAVKRLKLKGRKITEIDTSDPLSADYPRGLQGLLESRSIWVGVDCGFDFKLDDDRCIRISCNGCEGDYVGFSFETKNPTKRKHSAHSGTINDLSDLDDIDDDSCEIGLFDYGYSGANQIFGVLFGDIMKDKIISTEVTMSNYKDDRGENFPILNIQFENNLALTFECDAQGEYTSVGLKYS